MWCKRGTIGPAQEREVNPMHSTTTRKPTAAQEAASRADYVIATAGYAAFLRWLEANKAKHAESLKQ